MCQVGRESGFLRVPGVGTGEAQRPRGRGVGSAVSPEARSAGPAGMMVGDPVAGLSQALGSLPAPPAPAPSRGLGWGHPADEWPLPVVQHHLSAEAAVYRGKPSTQAGLLGSCPSTGRGLHPQKTQLCPPSAPRSHVCAPAHAPARTPTAPPSRLSVWLWMRRARASVQLGIFNYPPIIIDSSFENKSHIFFWFPQILSFESKHGGGRHSECRGGGGP